tara:strand:+ start:552 stop:1481 length:930 start_codon:yes stop_codon:yes gene_type:complete
MAYPELIASNLSKSKKNIPDLEAIKKAGGTGGTSLDIEQFEWEKNTNSYRDVTNRLRNETIRTENVRNDSADLMIEDYKKRQAGSIGYGEAPNFFTKKNEYERLKEGYKNSLYGCQSTTNSAYCSAGATTNEDATIYNRNVLSGSKLPFITGNTTNDENATALGFQLMPKGTQPGRGDNIRVNYDDNNSRNRGSGGTTHSAISDGKGTSYYNSGDIAKGVESGAGYSNPYFFELKKDGNQRSNDRVLRYVGKTNILKAEQKNTKSVSVQSPKAKAAAAASNKATQKSFFQKYSNIDVSKATSELNKLKR